MYLPPLRQLQYLVELRDTHHFGHAAENLHVTQSTLSTGIKELESHLGVTLVDRTNKSVIFTEVGNHIADRSRHIITQAEDLVEQAHAFSDPLSLPLKLGAIPTIAPYLVGDFVLSLRGKFEGIKLYIRENTTANLAREVIENKLDLVLLALPYDLGQVETRTIYREGFHLAFHKDTNILKGENIDFNALPDESLLLLDDGHCLRDHALAGCRLKNQKKIHTFGANSLQMLVQMVDNDLGVTLIPDMALEAGILQGTDIRTQQLPIEQFYRDIGFAWRKGNSREEFLQQLMENLQPRERPEVL